MLHCVTESKQLQQQRWLTTSINDVIIYVCEAPESNWRRNYKKNEGD